MRQGRGGWLPEGLRTRGHGELLPTCAAGGNGAGGAHAPHRPPPGTGPVAGKPAAPSSACILCMSPERSNASWRRGKVRRGSHLGRQRCGFLRSETYSYHRIPQSGSLEIYPKEVKTYVHTETDAQMFTAASLIIAHTPKPPRRPLVGEWEQKRPHTHSVDDCPVLTGNELSRRRTTWGPFTAPR